MTFLQYLTHKAVKEGRTLDASTWIKWARMADDQESKVFALRCADLQLEKATHDNRDRAERLRRVSRKIYDRAAGRAMRSFCGCSGEENCDCYFLEYASPEEAATYNELLSWVQQLMRSRYAIERKQKHVQSLLSIIVSPKLVAA